MIVERTPRTPVIVDTVLLRAGNRQASSSTQTRLGTESISQWERPTFVARPPRVGRPHATTHGDGRDVAVPTSAHDRSLPRSLGGTEMKFHIGDKVKLGSTRIGTITDVGTVLIQVKTSEGSLRVVCPWEVVRIPG
jgi:hypothetical protein